MLAFHGDEGLKAFVLSELAEHRRLDRLVQGYGYWEAGQGCAVGCTLEAVRVRAGDAEIDHEAHALYEPRLGIPQTIAQLEDGIFEGLPRAASRSWPERFISAIAPGADLTMVWPRFALWLLSEDLAPHAARDASVAAALAGVAALYREQIETGKSPAGARWLATRAAAAARVAIAAYGARAARGCAAHAAYAAVYPAAARACAADAVRATTTGVCAAYADDAASTSATRARQADKLIELLQAAPME